MEIKAKSERERERERGMTDWNYKSRRKTK